MAVYPFHTTIALFSMVYIGLKSFSLLTTMFLAGIGQGLEGLLHACSGGKALDVGVHFLVVINSNAHFSSSSESLCAKPPIMDFPHYRRFSLQRGRLLGDIFF